MLSTPEHEVCLLHGAQTHSLFTYVWCKHLAGYVLAEAAVTLHGCASLLISCNTTIIADFMQHNHHCFMQHNHHC